MKFKFEMDATESLPKHGIKGNKVTMEFEENAWPDIQEYFIQFLRGCGFVVDYEFGPMHERKQDEV